jgi:hypothetical protein
MQDESSTVIRACEQCGKSFAIRTARLKFTTGRFCSRACNWASNVKPLSEHLWASVTKTDDCWLWTGLLNDGGYGYVHRQNRMVRVHRFALEQAMGHPIPRGFRALHTCDVRHCVRNDDEGTYEVAGVIRPRWGHLFLGTATDNTNDCFAKGRMPDHGFIAPGHHPGERHPMAKLTETDVREIIRRYHAGGISMEALGREYGVRHSAISRIVRGKLWTHLT